MSGRRRRPLGIDPAEAEVEQLLRAAEDDLLLKLSVGTHSSRSSPLDPNLARRFEDLKSPPPPPSSAVQPRPLDPLITVTKGGASSASDDRQWGEVLGDDLAMRFAALKGSSSSGAGRSDPGIKNSGLEMPQRKLPFEEEEEKEEEEEEEEEEGGVSKKEVDKLLQWVMDSARLDPSKSDDEDDSSDDEEDLDLKRKIGKDEKVKLKKRRLIDDAVHFGQPMHILWLGCLGTIYFL
ncbi:histone-lysine N-methyltransferase EHMT2-like [Zingiber officinale]|uniref:histone-lysine N-methyltransferase EHMT2-like n=1 Tax=Zingiber officinale TaxID=94328 RepID=UPI001C4ACEE5|nr:histone-lysine N-methyltransferase EHMT2-like [Zingiber officinale]